jgi:hypothetical protein
MSLAHVLIVYEPYIYGDVLARLFKNLDVVEVVEHPSEDVDVVVFPTNTSGRPQLAFIPEYAPKAKLIAISPTGDCGWLRLPGESHWHKLQPFNLRDLCLEVCAGRERQTMSPPVTGLIPA